MPRINVNKDYLFRGTMKLAQTEFPKLTAGSSVFARLEEKIKKNDPMREVIKAQQPIMDLFNKVFPDVVETNEVGAHAHVWKKDEKITIEADPEPTASYGELKDIYIGGPASLCASAIQSQSPLESKNVLYGHEGRRGVSNWKGSASYFHIRDAIPVYYWPDNHGGYVLFITIKHALQKLFYPAWYMRQVKQNPNWNKLRFSILNFLKEPQLTALFAENQMNAFRDIGLHFQKTQFSKPENTTAYTSTHHAYLSHEIRSLLNTPKPLILQSSEMANSLHLHLGRDRGQYMVNYVFAILMKACGDLVGHRKLTEDELKVRGYDPRFVRQALDFPLDGYFPPYIDGMLEEMVTKGGGEVKNNMKLKKIFMSPTDNDLDARVSKILWQDTETGKDHITGVKSLHLSLGPNMKEMRVVNGNGNGNWLQKLFRPQESGNLMKRIMWASGSSIVFMVKVDKSKVPEHEMHKFRDHVDAHNKHIVRLSEKEVIVDGKAYQMFALQTTGGGAFPQKDVHCETAVNVMKANVCAVLKLDSTEGIEYDVIQVRSCARGITAQNIFRVNAHAANMVSIYGIGGIGMTMMLPNGLLMKAVMGARQQLADGEIDENEYERILRESAFTKIPHWSHRNPFERDYSQYVDYVHDPRYVSRLINNQHRSYNQALQLN